MDYQIVERFTKAELEKEIRALIKKGWKPQGGVHVYHNVVSGEYNKAMVFMQALVKD